MNLQFIINNTLCSNFTMLTHASQSLNESLTVTTQKNTNRNNWCFHSNWDNQIESIMLAFFSKIA